MAETKLNPKQIDKPVVTNGDNTELVIKANTIYKFANSITTLNIASVETSDYESVIYFETGSGEIIFTAPNTLKWYNIEGTPSLQPNTKYCVSVCNNEAKLYNFGTKEGTKVLNVVQQGTLTRNGTIYSGFSTSNYLKVANIISNGVLDVKGGEKNTSFFTTANNWKIRAKVYHKLDTSQGSNAQALFGIGHSWLLIGNNIGLFIQTDTDTQTARVDVNIDNIYNRILQIEAIYSSVNGYTINVYDENNILLGTGSDSRNPKCYSSQFRLGYNNNNRYLYDDLYLDGCSIEVEGQMWWKGVETL